MPNIIIPAKHRSYIKPTKPIKRRTIIGDGTPRSPVKMEDVEHIKIVIHYEVLSRLTEKGIKPLNDYLDFMGFDLRFPYEKFDEYDGPRTTTFFQCKEWV